MKTVEEILEALTEAENETVVYLWYNVVPIEQRNKFIKDALIGRLGWNIKRWDLMDFNLKLITASNRLLKPLPHYISYKIWTPAQLIN